MKIRNYISFLSLIILINILIFTNFEANARSLDNALKTSASAMQAQSLRAQIITENIANSETTGISPNQNPYQRKRIFFENIVDKKTGATLVNVKKIDRDNSDFRLVFRPDHPAADDEGYVKFPNVDRSLESMDLRESQRSYEANVTAIETTKSMMERALDLMR